MDVMEIDIDTLEQIIADSYADHLYKEGAFGSYRKKSQNIEYDYSSVILEVDMGRGPLSHEEKKQKFRESAIKYLEERLSINKELLRKKICDDAEYCKNRSAEGLNIVLSSLDGVLSVVIGYPVPLAVVSAWIVKKNWLDNLCACQA